MDSVQAIKALNTQFLEIIKQRAYIQIIKKAHLQSWGSEILKLNDNLQLNFDIDRKLTCSQIRSIVIHEMNANNVESSPELESRINKTVSSYATTIQIMRYYDEKDADLKVRQDEIAESLLDKFIVNYED